MGGKEGEKNGWLAGKMVSERDGWMDGSLDGRTDGWIDQGSMNTWIDPSIIPSMNRIKQVSVAILLKFNLPNCVIYFSSNCIVSTL